MEFPGVYTQITVVFTMLKWSYP